MPTRQSGAYSENTLVPSAARTASGDSGVWDGFSDSSTLRVQLDVTAVAGTSPSLSAFVEDTLDGTNWNAIGTFAAKTTVGHEVLNVTTPFANRIRVRWAMTGTTPSFTFSVVAVSQTVQAA